jgi:hypothetical protein
MPPKVWCDCTAFCNGGKHVSVRSWRRHAEHRRNLTTTFDNFQAALQFDPGDIDIDIDVDSESEGDNGSIGSTSHNDDYDIEDLRDNAEQDYDMEQGDMGDVGAMYHSESPSPEVCRGRSLPHSA